MGDSIYIVDPSTKKPIRVDAVSFADINVKERADLEQWVINHAEILGEPLLIVTSEFAKFDHSSRRLDVLALDEDGVLVIVELKLDVAGSLADQQAIRYAAFCSNMTMRQVVELYAGYHAVGEEEAEARILEFLETAELPELNDQPRIILAAGSMEDQELTSCVLWLRRFGIDISCVELTPYRMPDAQTIILVPRVIIPLPETRNYMIKAEQKQISRVKNEKSKSDNEALWRAIGDEFNKLGSELRTTGRSKNHYLQIPTGRGGVHYEWLLRKRDKCIDVAIHSEGSDLIANQQVVAPFATNRAAIESSVGAPLRIGPFGKKWTQVAVALPYSGVEPVSEIAPKAASLMKRLIEATWPELQKVTSGP